MNAEHTAYLNGDWGTDADFGASSKATKAASAPNASYLAKAKRLMETRLAADIANHNTTSGKKVTKRQEAVSRWEEQSSKEAKAMGRAVAAAAATVRSQSKEKHRASVAAEGERGSEARQVALSQLQQNKAAASNAKAKRKTMRPSVKGKKRQKKTSPHVMEPGDEDGADNESAAFSAEVVCCQQMKHHALRKLQQVPHGRLPGMNLKPGYDEEDGVEVAEPSDAPEASLRRHDALNSDVEGDARSDQWCNGVRSTVTSVHYRCKRKLAIVDSSVRFGANLILFIYGSGAGLPTSCEPLKSKSIPDWLKWVWLPTFTQSDNDNRAHAIRVPWYTEMEIADFGCGDAAEDTRSHWTK
ncbi:unnamed protein product [Phytophthora fragariaefolia]|uniref:Unnamed protein product n=1 Tax=Phytophthora fragariaefolia TaxID=1490495 RepID=A0A9W6XXK4_9STRA|nr:unnamed protein product [Phytophthora fragariaefolia]